MEEVQENNFRLVGRSKVKGNIVIEKINDGSLPVGTELYYYCPTKGGNIQCGMCIVGKALGGLDGLNLFRDITEIPSFILINADFEIQTE